MRKSPQIRLGLIVLALLSLFSLSPPALADQVELTPPAESVAQIVGGINPSGLFVTAISNFSITSVGVEFQTNFAVPVTVNIYAASGNTRGALLATATQLVSSSSTLQFYDTPISFNFVNGTDYDISVVLASSALVLCNLSF